MTHRYRGPLLVLAAATLWGTTGTSQALAPIGATPAAIGALRLALGGLVLFIYALASSGRAGLATQAPLQEREARGGLPRRTLLVAAICMAAYQLCFFAGVARTGVAVGTIVGIGSAPILGGVLGYAFRGERPGWPWALATLLAVAGAGLLASAGGEIHVDMLGLGLATAAGGAYAAFTLANKKLLENHLPAPVQAAVFLIAAFLLSPWLFSADLGWVAQPAGALVVLHLGVITVGVAYTLFALGLRLVPVSTAVTLTLAEPMTAGLLGVLLLGEPLTLRAAVGIALIFSGLVVLSLSSNRAAK